MEPIKIEGEKAKDILVDAMEACAKDEESTATEKLVALTAAIELYLKIEY